MLRLKNKNRLRRKASPVQTSYGWLKLSIVLFAVLPSILFLVSQLDRSEVAWNFIERELLVLLVFLCLFVVCDYIAMLAIRSNNGAILRSHFLVAHVKTAMISMRTGVVVLMGTYYLISYVLIAYRMKMGADFNTAIITDYYAEAFSGSIAILGPWVLAAIISGVLILWILFASTSAFVFKELSHASRNIDFSWRLSAALLTIVVGMYLHGGKTRASAAISEPQVAGIVSPIFTETETMQTSSTDSIFYLHLESGNGTILTQPMEVDGISYTGNYNPVIRKISNDGVYFPLFWGNNFITDRAMENILCGIIGNVQEAFMRRTGEITQKCLPALLKDAGYRTLYFLGFDNLSFANWWDFSKTAGFDEIINFSDPAYAGLLPEDMPRYEWGYDDCTFYKAVFDYLKKYEKSNEKLFVYVGVSSHHMPFDPKTPYAFTHPFKDPKNYVQKYLNSYAEQDYCVETFYKEYTAYKNKQTHLFISPDHSYPVWNHAGTTSDKWESFPENFRIHLTYIPSEERKNEFRVGETLNGNFSQNDLLPTIFSILNKENRHRSFAEVMQKNTNPENASGNCQILTQAHAGPDLAIVQGDQYYKYSMSERTLVLYNLKNDPEALSPIVLSNNMSYEAFREHYYCEEYKDS